MSLVSTFTMGLFDMATIMKFYYMYKNPHKIYSWYIFIVEIRILAANTIRDC